MGKDSPTFISADNVLINNKHVIVTDRDKKITNKKILKKINKMKIPPAYKNVKINLNKNASLIAIGFDDAGRTQRIYSKKHVKKRMVHSHLKSSCLFERMSPNSKTNRCVNQQNVRYELPVCCEIFAI